MYQKLSARPENWNWWTIYLLYWLPDWFRELSPDSDCGNPDISCPPEVSCPQSPWNPSAPDPSSTPVISKSSSPSPTGSSLIVESLLESPAWAVSEGSVLVNSVPLSELILKGVPVWVCVRWTVGGIFGGWNAGTLEESSELLNELTESWLSLLGSFFNMLPFAGLFWKLGLLRAEEGLRTFGAGGRGGGPCINGWLTSGLGTKLSCWTGTGMLKFGFA